MSCSVLVVGSQGMIGRMVEHTLVSAGLQVEGISRSGMGGFLPTSVQDWTKFLKDKFQQSSTTGYLINCVGLTKSHIPTNPPPSKRVLAIEANSLFPAKLAAACEANGVRMIQIQTDCVFSGNTGGYKEASPHDAIDLYGRSKSLGEVDSESLMSLRCSVIGPERQGKSTLFFEWLRNLPAKSEVNGFINHRWNGLTSLTVAKVILGIISMDMFRPGLQHLVPEDVLTKSQLVEMVLLSLGRSDVVVHRVRDSFPIDRSLATEFHDFNLALFRGAGFSRPPTIQTMVQNLAETLQREGN